MSNRSLSLIIDSGPGPAGASSRAEASRLEERRKPLRELQPAGRSGGGSNRWQFPHSQLKGQPRRAQQSINRLADNLAAE